jgi:hypothetical protein
MKKNILLTLFILLSVVSHAQNEAQVIPRRIFTGDPAVLILPLNNKTSETSDIVLSPLSHDFPSHPDIDFRRIVIEQRDGRRRLIIEFTAFAPGILEFPVIKIGETSFSGLSVTVNSVLDNRSSPVLSGPALTLAMPGTAFMLYGTITGLIIIILLIIWFILKGRILINNLIKKWKRRRLFYSIKKIEKRLSKSVLNGESGRIILDKLSEQVRIFLSVLTGKNCRTMTAREFEKLPLQITQNQNISSSFLHDFFRDCDDLRFSGIDTASQDILYLLACLRRFITALENTKKEAA